MYKIIGWDKLLDSIRKTRIVFLSGDQGTGKTLFSVALGYHMALTGYVRSCAYNFPVSFSHAPEPRNEFIGCDEAGLLFDSRSSFKMAHVSAFMTASIFNLRKRGSYVVVPSFIDVDKRLRGGTRIYRTKTMFKNRLWIYTWERGEEDVSLQVRGRNFWTGVFALYNPAFFFGSYDTYYAPPLYHTIRFLEQATKLTFQDLKQFTSSLLK